MQFSDRENTRRRLHDLAAHDLHKTRCKRCEKIIRKRPIKEGQRALFYWEYQKWGGGEGTYREKKFHLEKKDRLYLLYYFIIFILKVKESIETKIKKWYFLGKSKLSGVEPLPSKSTTFLDVAPQGSYKKNFEILLTSQKPCLQINGPCINLSICTSNTNG